MTTFTIDQLTAKVRELAAERPDFVYDAGPSSVCLYVHDDDQPGCIFGQALAALGVDADTLAELNKTGRIGRVLEKLEVEHTTDQGRWCNLVQGRQDTKTPWAKAVAHADLMADA